MNTTWHATEWQPGVSAWWNNFSARNQMASDAKAACDCGHKTNVLSEPVDGVGQCLKIATPAKFEVSGKGYSENEGQRTSEQQCAQELVETERTIAPVAPSRENRKHFHPLTSSNFQNN